MSAFQEFQPRSGSSSDKALLLETMVWFDWCESQLKEEKKQTKRVPNNKQLLAYTPKPFDDYPPIPKSEMEKRNRKKDLKPKRDEVYAEFAGKGSSTYQRIQFIATSKRTGSYPSLEKYGALHYEKVPGRSLYRHSVLVEGSIEEAEMVLKKVKQKEGYPRAFLADELIYHTPQPKKEKTVKVETNKTAPTTEIKPNLETPKSPNPLSLKDAYLVQFISLGKPDKPFDHLSQFGKTRIDMFPGRKLYRYYKGPYENKAAAKKALKQIQAAGRKKAYIVPLKERPSIIKDLEDIYK